MPCCLLLDFLNLVENISCWCLGGKTNMTQKCQHVSDMLEKGTASAEVQDEKTLLLSVFFVSLLCSSCPKWQWCYSH